MGRPLPNHLFLSWEKILTFGSVCLLRAGVLNLLVLAYPQIMLNPLHVLLNKNLTQFVPSNKKMVHCRDKKDRNGLFSRRFESCYLPTNCLRTSCELVAYPRLRIADLETYLHSVLYFFNAVTFNMITDNAILLQITNSTSLIRLSCRYSGSHLWFETSTKVIQLTELQYCRSRLMWSLWDRDKVITLAKW